MMRGKREYVRKEGGTALGFRSGEACDRRFHGGWTTASYNGTTRYAPSVPCGSPPVQYEYVKSTQFSAAGDRRVLTCV